MNEIDLQEFGRLVGAVERLAKQVDHMSVEIDKITNDLNRGKGVLVGLLVAAGGVGAAAGHLLEKLFR